MSSDSQSQDDKLEVIQQAATESDVTITELNASQTNLIQENTNLFDNTAQTDISSNPEFINEVEKENCNLREKLKHFENLGELVTDFKQDNEVLIEENQNLRLELEQLRRLLNPDPDCDVMNEFDVIDHVDPEEDLPMSPYDVIDSSLSQDEEKEIKEEPEVDDVEDDVFTQQPRNGVTFDQYHNVISNRSSVNEDVKLSPVEDKAENKKELVLENKASLSSSHPDEEETDPTSQVQYDVLQKVTEILVSNAEAMTSSHVTSDNDVIKREGVATQTSCNDTTMQDTNSTNKTPQLVNGDAQFLNMQIKSLEEMVGIGSHDPTNDVTNHEVSVTSQFAKLAGVFAVMSKKVVQNHKKAKNPEAFCHSLLAENEKTKLKLQKTETELHNLKIENERLSGDREMEPTTSETPLTTPARRKETPVSATTAKLQARIRKLEAQRAEIVNVNKQWDTQYKRLKSELDKTRRRSREASTHDVASSSHANQHHVTDDRRKLENDLTKAKKQIQTLMQEKSTLGRNYATAHAHYQSAKRDLAQVKKEKTKLQTDKQLLEAENVRLNQALEAAYNIYQRNSLSITSGGEGMNISSGERCNYLSSAPVDLLNSEEDPVFRGIPDHISSSPIFEDFKTQVEVLQQQVKIYREDFETERRDREKTQGEKQILEESLTRAQHEVQALNQQVRTHEQDFRQEKCDKERLQRKLQWYQRRDPHYRNEQDNFVQTRSPNDPPAYFTHRFGVDETNPTTSATNNSRTSSNRRRSTRPPHYPGTRHNRSEWNNNIDLEPILSYPPGDAAERLPAF